MCIRDSLTTDLHSMGQFIQDGARIMFETVIEIDDDECPIKMTEEPDNMDGLNYLSGLTLDAINKNAMKGTRIAHIDGGVPNLLVKVKDKSEYSLGELFYFFEFACGVSGYICLLYTSETFFLCRILAYYIFFCFNKCCYFLHIVILILECYCVKLQ